jgi:hypothetical protein
MLQKLCIEFRKKVYTSNKEINTTPHTYYNKIALLLRSDIKTNPKPNNLQNHSQTHHDKYNTDSYKNTIQFKINKYQHLFEVVISLKMVIQTKRKITTYIFYNKKALLKCGDIECNLGPKFNRLLNHLQIHQERQKTYFYNKTTQIKPEYNHIFELFNHSSIIH